MQSCSKKKTNSESNSHALLRESKSRQHLVLRGSGAGYRQKLWYQPETRTGGQSSAKPFLNASDPPGQLHILREERDAAGVYGEAIGTREEVN